MDVPAQRTLPAVRLEQGADGQFTISVGGQATPITPDSELRLDLHEFGWGPVWNSTVIVSVVDCAGVAAPLSTWEHPDVLDLHEIAPLVDGLRAVAAVVGCRVHVGEHPPEGF